MSLPTVDQIFLAVFFLSIFAVVALFWGYAAAKIAYRVANVVTARSSKKNSFNDVKKMFTFGTPAVAAVFAFAGVAVGAQFAQPNHLGMIGWFTGAGMWGVWCALKTQATKAICLCDTDD